MLVPIHIDVSSISDAFSVSEQDVRQMTANVVQAMVTDYMNFWEMQLKNLKGSRVEYRQGIYGRKINDLNYEVGLIGWLPNAIEGGISGFDQKEGFKSSSKVDYNKDGGWYLTIPFRHAVPGSISESSAFTNVQPSEVYKETIKLETGEGLDVKNLPKELQKKGIRPKLVVESRIFKEYVHKHSIHSGIQRKVDTKGRGTYVSFRRVGENSDDNSWIHKGIQARNFMDKALTELNSREEDIIAHQINSFIEQL